MPTGLPGERSIFDPDLLERCISCGFCLPACPTYRLTADEASSPRGRITLMRALQDGSLPADDPTLREQSSFCLGCRACEPVCPAGVRYGRLLEQWREHQWRGRHRPLLARVLMAAVRWPAVLGLAGLVRGAARPGARARSPVPAPDGAAGTRTGTRDGGSTPDPAAPVDPGPALMLGCFERVLYPSISRTARRLAPELAVPAGQGCCGALHAHNGDLAAGERMARELGERLRGTIVTTAGGCAGHLGTVLGADRVLELSAYLARRDARLLPAAGACGGGGGSCSGGPDRCGRDGGYGEVRVNGRRARVALQDSCHLRNGLGVSEQPRTLLRAVADYVELPGATDCCGSAGSYSLLRPRDSRRLLAAKLEQVEAAGVDFLVAVNPGCLRQLRAGLRRRRSTVRAVYLADLLAMARSTGAAPP